MELDIARLKIDICFAIAGNSASCDSLSVLGLNRKARPLVRLAISKTQIPEGSPWEG